MKIKTFNIEYDTDGDKELAESLPKEFEFEFEDIDDVENRLADFISDKTGFCVFKCDYKIIDNNKII